MDLFFKKIFIFFFWNRLHDRFSEYIIKLNERLFIFDAESPFDPFFKLINSYEGVFKNGKRAKQTSFTINCEEI